MWKKVTFYDKLLIFEDLWLKILVNDIFFFFDLKDLNICDISRKFGENPFTIKETAMNFCNFFLVFLM